MRIQRLNELLAGFAAARIAVVGDFFLDRYLVTDPALAEISVETGLEARQVVQVRPSPGAAGTVTNNLNALGACEIGAVGVIGDDGEGYELRQGLAATRVSCRHLLGRSDRRTPTYMKPMVREDGGEREMERLDIKNRGPMPVDAETQIVKAINQCVADGVRAIIVADQVQEAECGVVTSRVRAGLAAAADANPDLIVVADSRVRIGEFRSVRVKPNLSEALHAAGTDAGDDPLVAGERAGFELLRRTCRPVYVTMGSAGILVADQSGITAVPACRAVGPIDIVGAGDSVTAGITCALSAGASDAEAAAVGTLCAWVTIHKLGTTGTASPPEVLAAARQAGWPD